MPTPTTALEIIKTAMRLIGVIATGETPSAAEAADGLSALNDVIETWNTEGMTVYGSIATAFTATPNVGSYTIGPTGAFVTASPRPVRIDGVYASFQGVDFPVQQWTYDQYMGAAVKATASTYPTRYAYVNTFPNGQIYLWPVPAVAITLNLDIAVQIGAITSLATALTFPPGYARALQWELAAELAPQYGIELTATQVALARNAKAAIKKANHVPSVSRMDMVLTNGILPTWQGG
jgi:hypothetical protein